MRRRIFVLFNQKTSTMTTAFKGTIIPAVDMSIVLSQPHYETARIYPHLSAVILCTGLGIVFVRRGK